MHQSGYLEVNQQNHNMWHINISNCLIHPSLDRGKQNHTRSAICDWSISILSYIYFGEENVLLYYLQYI